MHSREVNDGSKVTFVYDDTPALIYRPATYKEAVEQARERFIIPKSDTIELRHQYLSVGYALVTEENWDKIFPTLHTLFVINLSTLNGRQPSPPSKPSAPKSALSPFSASVRPPPLSEFSPRPPRPLPSTNKLCASLLVAYIGSGNPLRDRVEYLPVELWKTATILDLKNILLDKWAVPVYGQSIWLGDRCLDDDEDCSLQELRIESGAIIVMVRGESGR